jgi:hypothetical protein
MTQKNIFTAVMIVIVLDIRAANESISGILRLRTDAMYYCEYCGNISMLVVIITTTTTTIVIIGKTAHFVPQPFIEGF